LREWIEAGGLPAHVETGNDGDRAGAHEILLETGEKRAECALAADQQSMGVLALGNARAVRGLRGQCVSLHHDHLLEVRRDRSCGRESAHAGTDHDGLPANQRRHHRFLARAQRNPAYRGHSRRRQPVKSVELVEHDYARRGASLNVCPWHLAVTEAFAESPLWVHFRTSCHAFHESLMRFKAGIGQALSQIWIYEHTSLAIRLGACGIDRTTCRAVLSSR
jgi:hypothetical protein